MLEVRRYTLLNTGGTPFLALLEVHPFDILLITIFLIARSLCQSIRLPGKSILVDDVALLKSTGRPHGIDGLTVLPAITLYPVLATNSLTLVILLSPQGDASGTVPHTCDTASCSLPAWPRSRPQPRLQSQPEYCLVKVVRPLIHHSGATRATVINYICTSQALSSIATGRANPRRHRSSPTKKGCTSSKAKMDVPPVYRRVYLQHDPWKKACMGSRRYCWITPNKQTRI